MGKFSKVAIKALAGLMFLVKSAPPASAGPDPVNVTNVLLANWPNAMQVSGRYPYCVGDGFRVFDISDRGHPVSLVTVPVAAGGTWLAVSDHYAYVLGGGSLSIFDISSPANPVRVGQLAGNWWRVTVSGRYAFLDTAIYDISNPANPLQVGKMDIQNPSSWTANFVSISGTFAYLAVNGIGLVVCDISDPTKPKQVAQAKTGYLGNYGTGYAFDIAVSGNYAYICACTNGMLQVFDISTPTNPVSVCTALAAPDAYRVSISGNYAYVVGYYDLRLSVLDISDPTNVTFVSAASTPGDTVAVAAAGNYVYVGEVQDFSGIGVYSLENMAPSLTIAPEGSNGISLFWPVPAPAFAVQQNPDLHPEHWTTLTNVPVVVGSKNQVTVSRPQGTMFYRLLSQ